MISPVRVWFDSDRLWVELSDGRVIGSPLSWYPRLAQASSAERMQFELSFEGVHWLSLDEDLSVRGFIEGGKGSRLRG